MPPNPLGGSSAARRHLRPFEKPRPPQPRWPGWRVPANCLVSKFRQGVRAGRAPPNLRLRFHRASEHAKVVAISLPTRQISLTRRRNFLRAIFSVCNRVRARCGFRENSERALTPDTAAYDGNLEDRSALVSTTLHDARAVSNELVLKVLVPLARRCSPIAGSCDSHNAPACRNGAVSRICYDN